MNRIGMTDEEARAKRGASAFGRIYGTGSPTKKRLRDALDARARTMVVPPATRKTVARGRRVSKGAKARAKAEVERLLPLARKRLADEIARPWREAFPRLFKS